MKLTNAIRKQVALDMAKELIPDPTELQNLLKARLYMLARQNIPAEVLHGFDKYPRYYDKTSNIKMKKKGWSGNWYVNTLDRMVDVALPQDGWAIYLEYDEACNDLDDKIEDIVEKQTTLQMRLTNVLMGVNTAKQLEEVLPEAVKYLPNQAGGALVPMAEYAALRKEIELLKESKKE